MLINTLMPDFCLPDLNGRIHCLSNYAGNFVVVNFWSAECPWSKRADMHLATLTGELPGLVVLNIASNLNESVELIMQSVRGGGIGTVLRDADCKVADMYEAQNTPHVFVGDRTGILRYEGALDDITFRKRIAERSYVKEALFALLKNQLPDIQQVPPYGCTIVRHA